MQREASDEDEIILYADTVKTLMTELSGTPLVVERFHCTPLSVNVSASESDFRSCVYMGMAPSAFPNLPTSCRLHLPRGERCCRRPNAVALFARAVPLSPHGLRAHCCRDSRSPCRPAPPSKRVTK
ncbi:unnamed protein product [Chondrus crispus]|uniref:Uncharacterized protein n=1 Tax=Chondrus crispus TaxID=2769 RepID=R7QS22_CHOCR|nr:unnamed protein product [Chondrus crispus]CDF40185.1 unnamed protein product [Chondrus crispus]|eukprot:XP_005710479.1 unnamed protein product [Chondrus crispus]